MTDKTLPRPHASLLIANVSDGEASPILAARDDAAAALGRAMVERGLVAAVICGRDLPGVPGAIEIEVVIATDQRHRLPAIEAWIERFVRGEIVPVEPGRIMRGGTA